MQAEIEHCPFCPASEPTVVLDNGGSSRGGDRVVYVECMKCHARGPYECVEGDDVDEASWRAITLWNLREDE